MNYFLVLLLVFACNTWHASAAPDVAITAPEAAIAAKLAPLIEAESVFASGRVVGGGKTPDRKLTAWGGACLGEGWGQRGDWAQYDVELPDGPLVLHLRYARQQPISPLKTGALKESSAHLRVSLAGRETDFALPATVSWDVWQWIAVPLETSPLARGSQVLRLEALDGGPVNLDALVVAAAGQRPPQVARQLLFDGSRHLRIQLSPGVKALEVDQLFAIGEATYTFLRDYLGEEPAQRLTVHVIAPAEKRDDFVGHSNGYALYLEEARIFDTGHNWVHEMTHCFQRDTISWPTWLSEGEAWLTYYEAETALWGRAPDQIIFAPARFEARLPALRRELLADQRNWLQLWGRPGFPSHKTSAAYGFSNHILATLRQRCGPRLMSRYRALLRQEFSAEPDQENLPIEKRDAAVVDRLSRATAQDLRPLFEQWQFHLAPETTRRRPIPNQP